MQIWPGACYLFLAAGALLLGPASGTLPAAAGRRQYADLSTARDANGATECPCVTSFPAQAAVPSLLSAKGFPATYGLQGCKAYDAALERASAKAAAGCNGTAQQPRYCRDPWCYIDAETCKSDAAKCAAAGGAMGSYTHPSCRSRDSTASFVLKRDNVSLFFSFQTCGSLDHFTENALRDEVRGWHYTAVAGADASRQWAFPKGFVEASPFDLKTPAWKGNSGLLVAILDSIMHKHSPPLQVTVLPGWSSEQSRQVFPESSFTACIQDVLVGKVDLCISDFWVTSARLSMGAEFLNPPIGSDDFYLVAPSKEQGQSLSFIEILAKPWAPFEFNLWVSFFAFIFFTSLVTLLTDAILDVGDQFEDNEDENNFNNPTIIGMYFKSTYLNFLAYVSASPVNTPTSVPGRLAAVGFGWFLLITIASYTANLASILVSNQKAVNYITSIDDALAQQKKICAHVLLVPELMATFPTAKLEVLRDSNAVVRGLRKGDCEVALIQYNKIEEAMAGITNEGDCKSIDNGMTAAEAAKTSSGAFCVRDASNKPDETDFCRKFQTVGTKVISIPVSIPVTKALVKSFSYTFRQMESSGEIVTMKNSATKRLEGKLSMKCVASEKATQGGSQLSLSSMQGTFYIAIFVQVVALILGLFEFCTKRTIQDWLGLYSHHTNKPPPEHDHEKSHVLTRVEFSTQMAELKSLLLAQQKAPVGYPPSVSSPLNLQAAGATTSPLPAYRPGPPAVVAHSQGPMAVMDTNMYQQLPTFPRAGSFVFGQDIARFGQNGGRGLSADGDFVWEPVPSGSIEKHPYQQGNGY